MDGVSSSKWNFIQTFMLNYKFKQKPFLSTQNFWIVFELLILEFPDLIHNFSPCETFHFSPVKEKKENFFRIIQMAEKLIHDSIQVSLPRSKESGDWLSQKLCST